MVNIVNRTRYFLDIEPELRNKMKSEAALQGKTMKEWLTEAIVSKLEDDIDIRESNEALKETEGTIELREYMKLRGDA
jgi:hypothetical protein